MITARLIAISAAAAAVACSSLALHPAASETSRLPAQPAKGAAPGKLADSPVARMIGEWKGTSWMIGRDGQRHEGEAVERVRWNLAGTAMIVEGYGYSTDETTGERTTGHDAMGVIELDEKTGEVIFYARRAGAPFHKHTIQIDDADGTMRWSPDPTPGVEVRFIINLTDDRWQEVGEMSRDGGATWTTFLGTDLKRVRGG